MPEHNDDNIIILPTVRGAHNIHIAYFFLIIISFFVNDAPDAPILGKSDMFRGSTI
jgi:hypothetical protein